MVTRRPAFTRRTAAKRTRDEAAELAFLRMHPRHLSNGEEITYRSTATGQLSYIANYTKGLNHDALGEVDPIAYRAMLRAITSGDPRDFETIPLVGPRKLVNPQAGLAFDLEGPDAEAVVVQPGPAGEPISLRPAPRIDSAEVAGEMGELYWMGLLRDVSFVDYGVDAGPNTTNDAVASLNNFSDFRGPKQGTPPVVTVNTLFRGFTPGDLAGPYVSQFLLRPIPFGTLIINQRQRTAQPNTDYLITFAEWRNVQNGNLGGPDVFDPLRRYIRNMRDLATYVHFDALYEAYFNACLILLGMDAPRDPGNPYELRTGPPPINISSTQAGFGTFGDPHILTLVTEVATRALKAVWHQKWFVHRRLRPEAFGGLVHNHVTGAAAYPIHPEILNVGAGSVLARIRAFNQAKAPANPAFNTHLLPQAFPEGSPMHPAYGAGHATVAGACVTILKAWFDESFEILNPVVPNRQGQPFPFFDEGVLLVPAPAVMPPLTVGGELNKLAANIAIGRNMAGVHWRSDYTESLRLGEAIAIGILEEQKLCYNEDHSFSLTKFDGTAITI